MTTEQERLPKGRKPTTILVVDDEEIVCRMYKVLTEHLGYRTLVAGNGTAALEIFRTHQAEIDLVLLDYCMPGMDGMTTFLELKKIKPDIKVILSSGLEKEEAAENFRDTGLAGFLQKPFRRDDLQQLLQTIVKPDFRDCD